VAALWVSVGRIGVRISLAGLGPNVRQLIGFALPSFLGGLPAAPIHTCVMSYIAAQPGGLNQVGLWTAAGRLTSLYGFLPGAMAVTIIPALATEWGRGDRARFQNATLTAIRIFWLVALPLAVFFIGASGALLTIFYGSAFRSAWPMACLLLLAALLRSLNETADRAFAAAGHVWTSTTNNYLSILISIPLTLVLVPAYLALGYASAQLLAWLPYLAIQMHALRRLYAIPLRPIVRMLLYSSPLAVPVLVVAISGTALGAAQIPVAAAIAGSAIALEYRLLLLDSERRPVARRIRRWCMGDVAVVRRSK